MLTHLSVVSGGEGYVRRRQTVKAGTGFVQTEGFASPMRRETRKGFHH